MIKKIEACWKSSGWLSGWVPELISSKSQLGIASLYILFKPQQCWLDISFPWEPVLSWEGWWVGGESVSVRKWKVRRRLVTIALVTNLIQTRPNCQPKSLRSLQKQQARKAQRCNSYSPNLKLTHSLTIASKNLSPGDGWWYAPTCVTSASASAVFLLDKFQRPLFVSISISKVPPPHTHMMGSTELPGH